MTQSSPEVFGKQTRHKIRRLFERQGLAVLSTKDADGHPYASLIAYAASEDLSELYFITPRATRKNANLSHDPRVALLINDCANKPSDFHQAMAVTVLGRAHPVDGGRRKEILSVYLRRHAYLRQFAHSSSSALYAVEITGFTMVQQFQNVSELRLDQGLDNDA